MKSHFYVCALRIALLALATSSATAETRMQVSAASTPIYTQASASGQPIGKASSGEILFVSRVDGDWAAIAPPDRLSVWLNKDFIEGNRVIAKSIQVRSGPGVQFDVVGTLERSAPVMPRGEDGDWAQIAPPSSTTFWVKTADLSEIRPQTTPIRDVATVTKPIPAPATPTPAPASAPQPTPAPQPAPTPAPAPQPAPQPAPEPSPVPQPVQPAPAPAPQPPVAAAPVQVAPSIPHTPAPQPAVRPTPAPAPAPVAKPKPAPAPKPVATAPALAVQPTHPAPAAPAPAVPAPPTLRPATALPTTQPAPAKTPPATTKPAATIPLRRSPEMPAVTKAVPAPASTVAAQKSKDVAVEVDPALVEDLDLLDQSYQGRSVQVEGELRNAPFMAASPSRYRLLATTDGELEMVCHIHGDPALLRQYTGKGVSIRGREYWVESSDMPVVVVGQIVPLAPTSEPVMF